MTENSTWMAPAEAAPEFGYNLNQMHRALREGLLPASIRVLKIGRQYRLNRADVLGLNDLRKSETAETRLSLAATA